MMGRVLSGCIQLGRVSWINSSSVKKCSTTPSSSWKKELPEHIVPLKVGSCHVYLVGTNHFSQKSVEDVRRIVGVVKPDVVFLELCLKRRGVLTLERIPTIDEVINARMKKKDYNNLFHLVLSCMYLEIGRELKIIPGSEFRIAYQEAIKYGGKVVLGDRPIEVTLKRAQRKVTLSELINGCFSPFPTDDELPLPPSLKKDCSGIVEFLVGCSKELEDIEMDTINRISQELSKRLPNLANTLLHERDIFMAKGILNVAKNRSCVVAVVGMAHLDGIKKHFQHQQKLDDLSVDDLLTVPPPKHTAKIITCIGVFMAGVAIIWKYL
ncbi:hypothetical protein PIB30_057983 [Stylosanthes scabra]|uniref:TraB domain-containing protein n=1 Tax=Stylosanthes scabra TaxID=79078 RepID=A0ABU6UIW5_9FABA|nr:hypothetical protein [Stylosanthes scabra]